MRHMADSSATEKRLGHRLFWRKKHGIATHCVLGRNFFLHDIPMFDKLSVDDSEDIDSNQRLGCPTGVPAVNCDELAFSNDHAHFVFEFGRQSTNQVRDPLIKNETQPTQTMAAMVRADERLKQGFPQITLPVLILHGTADKNTRPSGSQHFYDNAGSSDKTLKFYDGGFHDLLNDVDKDVVLADIIAWINGHLVATGHIPEELPALAH
jgi:pimeloyl-ACP methyl ester carboxylesterase